MLRQLLNALLVLALAGACSMKPIPREELAQDQVSGVLDSLAQFRKQEKLLPFFAEAEVIAVYPWSFRGANGVGLAYGSGLVFDREDSPIGYTRMYQITAGPQIGAQAYRQVLGSKPVPVLK